MKKLVLSAALTFSAATALPAAAQQTYPHAPQAGMSTYGGSIGNAGSLAAYRRVWFTESERALRRGDVEGAFRALQSGARAGDPVSMRGIAQLYLEGPGELDPNPSEALRWFYEAALSGDPVSMFVLGRAFERGIGVEADPALGRAWLRQARRAGYRRTA